MPGLNLTRAEAQERSQVITRVESYDVNLDLTTGDTTFRNATTIRFDAAAGSDTFIDLAVDTLYSARLNGTDLDTSEYADYRLPLRDLREKNVLEIDADFFYMHTGEGLHRSVDPTDGQVYLYSQFEVADARRVFPVFEQPDLKASLTLTVTVPRGWTVFSVSPTPTPEDRGDKLRFAFAPTQRISSYINAVVAGPYVGQERTIRSLDGREIELGTYCRRSLLPYLDADLVMGITEAGFGFFENAFGVPYPFTKYDQIFVPEYNAGAMENAGCVTLRDQYLFRSRPTEWELESLCNIILHELAHMWFGDLVTMRWWDDLWLNESFAEYMAHLATAEATRWTDAWVGFMARKEWGLAQDQKPSTHPVATEMLDLEDVEVNFDGITYAKGAAVLRQMVSYVGRDNFFKGLHRYLVKHAYQNATLNDLISELEAASGREMRNWVKLWVEEPGVTLLRPEITVNEGGALTQLDVVQETFSPGSSLRPHRMIVSGYDLSEDGEHVEKVFSSELDVEGSRTSVAEAIGLPRPSLILVNDGDLAYAKVRLDEDSLAFAITNIAKISDALTRRVIMASAWDMTRDGEFPASQFLALALEELSVETNVGTLSSLLRHIDTAVTCYVAPSTRDAQLHIVAEAFLEMVTAAPPASDAQELLMLALTRRAMTEEQYGFINRLYHEEEVLEGLAMSPDMRWALLFALVRAGLAGEDEIIAERERDNTLTGEQNAARARATIDSFDTRETVWDAVMTNTAIPNDTRWAMVQGFWAHAVTQPSVYESFVPRYYEGIVDVWERYTFTISSRLIQLMEPSILTGYLPGADIVGRTVRWLDDNANQSVTLRRLVAEGEDDAERMEKAQGADAEASL